MQSISTPLERLHAEAQWFCRDHAAKLLWIRCCGELRKTALQLLPGYEFHHDNRSAWLVLEDAWQRDREGWDVRATRLVKDWAARGEAFARVGTPMPAVELGAAEHVGDVDGFRRVAASVCASLREPLHGYVLVLAPTLLEDLLKLEDQLFALISAGELQALRWVVVTDVERGAPTRLLQALGERGLECECRVDDASQAKDLDAMLHPDRVEGVGLGAAPLGVTPPRRVGAPAPMDPAEQAKLLREAGLNPEYLAAAPQIRADVLAAALAMKQGRWQDALTRQSAARDRSAAISEPMLTVLCQMTLASYQSGLGQRDRAIVELQSAAALAHTHGLWVQLSQAHLSLALVHALDRNVTAAIEAYVAAADAAKRGESTLLEIESWRMAGQLLLQHGQSHDAMTCFHRAIVAAGDKPPAEVSRSSAAEAARQLASLYQQRGQTAQATSLYDQADQFEAGEASQQQE